MLPGKPVVVAFINMTLNSEDAYCVSKEFAELVAFAWMGYMDYPIPVDGVVEPGMVVENETYKVYMNKRGDTSATIAIFMNNLEIGDKLANWHGIKFTVGCLVLCKDMIELEDDTTGSSSSQT